MFLSILPFPASPICCQRVQLAVVQVYRLTLTVHFYYVFHISGMLWRMIITRGMSAGDLEESIILLEHPVHIQTYELTFINGYL